MQSVQCRRRFPLAPAAGIQHLPLIPALTNLPPCSLEDALRQQAAVLNKRSREWAEREQELGATHTRSHGATAAARAELAAAQVRALGCCGGGAAVRLLPLFACPLQQACQHSQPPSPACMHA